MNTEKYKADIANLIKEGNLLLYAMFLEQNPSEKVKHAAALKKLERPLPDFSDEYQQWYSEALECLEQMLPARVEDFIGYYKNSKNRKEITHENYSISDYLQGLSVTKGLETLVDPRTAVGKFKQQLRIVESLQRKFESSLFDIQALAQADLFQNELDAAKELNSRGFTRASGAVAGVVLETHLKTICEKHKITVSKAKPNISDFNDALKKKQIVDTATWRRTQLLADIRNSCDHKTERDPKPEDIDELISGVNRTMKTVL